MADGFKITKVGSYFIVETEAFRMKFDIETCGIRSLVYQTGETWHECIDIEILPPTIFGPYYVTEDVEGGVLYPGNGSDCNISIDTQWMVGFKHLGELLNETMEPEGDFQYEADFLVWPSGRIACSLKATNDSGSDVTLDEEAYRLNPADDPDINPERDTAPNLDWFGFYSNNTGNDEDDYSCDGIAVSYNPRLSEYGTSGNINRIYQPTSDWMDGRDRVAMFLLALAVDGSWGDCADALELQARGDALSNDLLHPDPLDGSATAGDVLVGSLVDGGFSPDVSAYVLQV